MKSNDMQAALRAFLDANPDLPEGESAETPDDASTATPAFRLDIILEKKGSRRQTGYYHIRVAGLRRGIARPCRHAKETSCHGRLGSWRGNSYPG